MQPSEKPDLDYAGVVPGEAVDLGAGCEHSIPDTHTRPHSSPAAVSGLIQAPSLRHPGLLTMRLPPVGAMGLSGSVRAAHQSPTAGCLTCCLIVVLVYMIKL